MQRISFSSSYHYFLSSLQDVDWVFMVFTLISTYFLAHLVYALFQSVTRSRDKNEDLSLQFRCKLLEEPETGTVLMLIWRI